MEKELILKNRLKEIRTEQGLSQANLAEIVGVSRNTISSISTREEELSLLENETCTFYF